MVYTIHKYGEFIDKLGDCQLLKESAHDMVTYVRIINLTWYDCRCRISECDKEAIYQPEWLRYAVPHEGDKPSSCQRYPPFSAPNSTDGPPTYNETTCSPDIFDNTSTVKCKEWVFETEEWTIANEVTFVYVSDRFRP